MNSVFSVCHHYCISTYNHDIKVNLVVLHKANADFNTYKKDTTANAIVPYKKGNFNTIHHLEFTVINHPFFRNDDDKEGAYDIHDITDNGLIRP